MPTTLTGFILFLVLLLPGLFFVMGRERKATERKLSALRETVSVAAASVTADLGVAILAFTLDSILSSRGRVSLIRPFIESPAIQWETHRVELLVWGVVALFVATALSYTAGRWIIPPPHESTASAWWNVFEAELRSNRRKYRRDFAILVGCYLDDGSFISGALNRWNSIADDTADRDITLTQPLTMKQMTWSKDVEMVEDYVVISARRIVTMTVDYRGQARWRHPMRVRFSRRLLVMMSRLRKWAQRAAVRRDARAQRDQSSEVEP